VYDGIAWNTPRFGEHIKTWVVKPICHCGLAA
jgi:hypothetical protein